MQQYLHFYPILGEIRSSIAPRKPERTASMRGEIDSIVDLPRRSRPIGQYENLKPGSSCSETSSINDNISKESDFSEIESTPVISRNLSNASDISLTKTIKDNIQYNEINTNQSPYNTLSSDRTKRRGDLLDKSSILKDGIKISVQKMSSTIDSYLKDKMSSSTAPSPTSTLKSNSSMNNNFRNINEIVELRTSIHFDRSSLLETSNTSNDFVCDKSKYRKSEQIDLYSKQFNQGKTNIINYSY